MNAMTKAARFGPITDDERYAVARRHFATSSPSKIRALVRSKLLDVMILGRLAAVPKGK